MLFPTIEYAAFFLVVLSLAWLIYRNSTLHRFFLLAASYAFYSFWNWHYCFLIFILSAVAWLIARMMMAKSFGIPPKYYLSIGITFCITVLAYYKYTGFIVTSLVSLSAWFANAIDISNFETPLLPLGISFVTFHAISLLFDVYRKKVKHRPSLLNVLLYVSFFPQLIAGPILRASYFLPQLERNRRARSIRITKAGILITLGLFKKVILANYLATMLVDNTFANAGYEDSTLLGVYGYAIQIFCDFSGYTDIAIGCAMLLGYNIPLNFRNPYRAHSIQDFWHRWHISLSSWLRDYLYIPLGGSRHGVARTLFALMLTMLLGGLWHGAGWQFILWGGYHGLLLVLYQCWTRWANPRNLAWRKSKAWRVASIFFVFHFVTFGWIMFRAPNLSDAVNIMTRIGHELMTGTVFLHADVYAVLAILTGLGLQYIPIKTRARIERRLGDLYWWLQGSIMALCIAFIEYFGPIGVAPFIYFQF